MYLLLFSAPLASSWQIHRKALESYFLLDMLGPGTQCTPCIASVPVLFAQPMDLNVLLLDRCGPPTLQHTKWSYSNCGAAVQSTNTELSSKREQCPFRKKSYQCIQIIWCYAAFHGTLVEWMTHCSKSHRLKYIAASKDLTDTLVLKEVCALSALCSCAQETIISMRCSFHFYMLTYTVPVASNNPKNEKRDVRNRNQITQAESVPMGQYFIQQFHFVCLISGSLSCSYFYQAVPVFYAHTTKENHPLKTVSVDSVGGFCFFG